MTDTEQQKSYVAGGVLDPPDEAWPTKGEKPGLPEGLRRERKGPLPRKPVADEKP